MIYAFFGERPVKPSLKEYLKWQVISLALRGEKAHFYVGTDTDFEKEVVAALRELKKRYAHLSYKLIFTSEAVRQEMTSKKYRNEQCYLLRVLEDLPREEAIYQRNLWLIDTADMLVCNVRRKDKKMCNAVERAIACDKEVKNLVHLSCTVPM